MISEEEPSKSARKREAERLKQVGKALTERSPAALAELDLPEALAEAIAEYRRMPSHGARRRQLQLIGKQLRDLDADAALALQEAIDTQDGVSAQAVYEHAQLERWRDTLIDSDEALTEYLSAHPDTDRQKLRALIKRTRSATGDQQRTIAARTLFRFLRDGN
jgi:ribosome-associated protein